MGRSHTRPYQGEFGTPITLHDQGLVFVEFRPDLDFDTIRGNKGIPTLVTRGIFRGFSLPVYADDNEELFVAICVPDRYDESSDIIVHIYCWLAAAEDSKNFRFQLSWEHYTPGVDVVPLITSNNVEVETPTGAGAAEGQSYKITFVIDYDIDTPDDIVADDILQLRLRRIDASADEAAGEIVVNHTGVIFRRNKLGATTV